MSDTIIWTLTQKQKWLNSLHIKSFFDYLMGIPNDYWTKIPDNPDPTAQLVRDGVALEDDMALRALLPHIRPKRGRRRADDADNTPLTQRPRLSPFSEDAQGQSDSLHSAHLTGSQHFLHPQIPRSAHPGLGPNNGSHTPFSRWPNSAITPATRESFWDDSLEPSSAITSLHGKLGRVRRGAKNVSSAWTPGGAEGSGKKRGRPPVDRTPIEGQGYSFRSWNPIESGALVKSSASTIPEPPNGPLVQTTNPATAGTPAPVPVSNSESQYQTTLNNARPVRPSISLQVPRRTGAPVRLATPPPMVLVNGENGSNETTNTADNAEGANRLNRLIQETTDRYKTANEEAPIGIPDAKNITNYYFERLDDRTNVDSLLSYFMRACQESQWFDADGKPDEPASIGESAAIVNATLQTMLETATSLQAFLINLAALAGARSLMTTEGRCFRMGEDDGYYKYRIHWEYRFAHFTGHFNIAQKVPFSMWKKPTPGKPSDEGDEESLSVEEWQRKYKALLGEMKKRDQELEDLRARVLKSVRGDEERQ